MTTRRTAMRALLSGLGSGTLVSANPLQQDAWRAYQAVEEEWIRERHALLVDQCPECPDAAAIDLELKIAELHRRELEFQYLSKNNPQQLRGTMWQLSWLPLSDVELAKMMSANPAYRRQEERVRRLSQDLKGHAEYDDFRRAQTRLWKTPEYRSVHRRYSGRLQELNRVYGTHHLRAK